MAVPFRLRTDVFCISVRGLAQGAVMNITILIALVAFVLFCLISAIVVYFALVLAGRDDDVLNKSKIKRKWRQ